MPNLEEMKWGEEGEQIQGSFLLVVPVRLICGAFRHCPTSGSMFSTSNFMIRLGRPCIILKYQDIYTSFIARTHPFSSMASTHATKRQKSSKDVPYELIYWPGIPGRGEHVRLALEEAGAEYTDTATEKDGMQNVLAAIDPKSTGDELNPPTCAPPILKHGDLIINQTPNILLYLGPRLGLVPSKEEDEDAIYKINALALTALDGLSNEPHDCHHPIAVSKYYEDQKTEAKAKSADYVANRLPKFLGYFERVLAGEASKGGKWLYGGQFSYADLVLFQCVDGVKFAFPKAMARLEKEEGYRHVFALHESVKNRPRIKEYLASERRQRYSQGIYRHYPELDEE
jgi:glutathione S-transferase